MLPIVSTLPRPGDLSGRDWSRAAYGYGVLVGLGLSYFLIRMPYQVSDDLGDILIIQAASFWTILVSQLTGEAFLRPVMWLQQKAVFELAPGEHYFATYKAFHIAQLLVVVVLFVRLLRVRRAIDAVVLPLALAALFGLHTYNITMREAYPVNHFMSILASCLAVVNLALSRGRWWHDVLAILVLVYALFMIETGILVWVCLVTAYVVRWRGISRTAVIIATAILAAYFVLRFFVLDIGAPGLIERSSGYGFSVRDEDELVELFGNAPWKFYAYNVVCSALTVLFSEPRAGRFQFTALAIQGEIPPWSVVNVVTSTLSTAFIILLAIRRMRRWRQEGLKHEDGVLLLLLTVLAANSAISYPYTKDVVMSPAGVFYAAALFMGVRDAIERLGPGTPRRMAVLVAVPLLIMSAGWTLRAATLVETMRETAFVNRSDWTVAEEHMDRDSPDWRGRHPDAQTLARQLREEVIRMPVPQPYTLPRWTRGWFDEY